MSIWPLCEFSVTFYNAWPFLGIFGILKGYTGPFFFRSISGQLEWFWTNTVSLWGHFADTQGSLWQHFGIIFRGIDVAKTGWFLLEEGETKKSLRNGFGGKKVIFIPARTHFCETLGYRNTFIKRSCWTLLHLLGFWPLYSALRGLRCGVTQRHAGPWCRRAKRQATGLKGNVSVRSKRPENWM